MISNRSSVTDRSIGFSIEPDYIREMLKSDFLISFIKNGDKMPTYVILGKWTQKRIETIKNLPDAIKEGTKAFESYGVKIKELVFTMGRYDVVAIGEAPNE